MTHRNASRPWNAVIVVALGACGSSSQPPAPLASTTPGDLEGAPAWIYRTFSTGKIVTESDLVTYTLRRRGDGALITVAKQTSQNRLNGSIGAWGPAETTSLTGKIETRGSAIRIVAHGGADKLELECTPGKLPVALATAVRVRSPGYSECGDRGRWSPAETQQVEVLRCNPIADDEMDPDRKHNFVFAPAPGIEFLYVNDDCIIQGGGYRAIAPGGAIGPARPKAAEED